jgi:hypothetical protein
VKFYFNFAAYAAASRHVTPLAAPRLPTPIAIPNPI